ncbi:MAG: nucleotidyltransferase domain-containing protein [Flavisolibacter sp.]|nr:nucleotidyltransferase domain-containing protein [Flavisolibacter sp.]
MTIRDLRDKNLIVLECISGSKSYGLDLHGSDTDLKGVFVLPEKDYYGLNYIEQVSSEKQDVLFYELKRFFELLLRNNPNIIELLGIPPECIVYKHPLMNEVKPELFLSKLCRQTFANYALSQIKKARGLNKKINKPMDEERKTILHFCYVTAGSGSRPLLEWLQQHNLQQEQCGLAALNHMRDMYALFTDRTCTLGYNGIVRNAFSNDVQLSSIPKGEQPLTYLYFNKDGYSVYCKDYKSYWEWVENRNELRYQNTLQHGKHYDAKNMMHVFRLLDMAQEIAEGKGVIIKRPNRDFLLSIRSGQFDYDALMEKAEQKMEQIEIQYQQSSLPEEPDTATVNNLLVELRRKFYIK